MFSENTKRPPLLPLVIILFGAITAFHLGGALLGKTAARFDHLGAALEYAHRPINLLRPVILGANATGTPTALELPLWQATVGLVFKVTRSTWFGWASLVSLLFFATALWPFRQLGKRYIGARAADWALVFFLAQPLIIFEAGQASVDAFCLVLTIWFLFFADKMISSGDARWWLPTALFACLSAVTKPPFFMAAGLFGIFLLLNQSPRSWRSWILLATAGAVAVLAFAAWTRYTDSLLAQAEFPFMDMRISQNPGVAQFFFGDWHFRLNPANWIRGGWRFLHATLGAMVMALLLGDALFRRGHRLPKLWLLATLLTTLVFTSVVLLHWHYFLMSCPAVALLCGVTLARWEDFWTQQIPAPWLRLSVVGLVLVLSAIDGLVAMKIGIYYDYFPQEVATIIQQHSKPEDKLLVHSVINLWGGEELYRAGRDGLYVATVDKIEVAGNNTSLRDLLDNEASLRRLKSLGYTKVVLISQSPVRFAVQAVNPGSHITRLFYPEHISPTVDAWPVVYHSEDLLIKKIP